MHVELNLQVVGPNPRIVTGCSEVWAQELDLQYSHQAAGELDLRAEHRGGALGVYELKAGDEESLEQVRDPVKNLLADGFALRTCKLRCEFGEPALEM